MDLSSLPDGRGIAYSGGCLHICLIYGFYHLTSLCNNSYGLSALVGCWYSIFIRRIVYKFLNACPFDYTAFAVSWKVEILLSGLTTPVGWLSLPPTDRPKSIRKRCVIEVVGAVCLLSCCFLCFYVCVRDFVTGLGQISSFFSIY